MVVKMILLCGATLAVACLCGCGGGGGDQSGTSGEQLTQMRVIDTTRISRHLYAIVGFIRTARQAAALANARPKPHIIRSRDVKPGYDPGLRLYFLTTDAEDGSGRQDLFTDGADQDSAGYFTWSAPAWAGGVQTTYPVKYLVQYRITAGDLTGDSGSATVTLSDSTGANGTVELDFAEPNSVSGTALFTVTNGVMKATSNVKTGEWGGYQETDYADALGAWICTFVFTDGCWETATTAPDGTETEVYDDAAGNADATGTIDNSGEDTIDYNDGSSETVDVDSNYDTVDEENAIARRYIAHRSGRPVRSRTVLSATSQ